MTNRRVLYRRINPIGAAESVISGLSPTAWYHMRGSGVPTASGGFASMWPDMADTDNGLVLPGAAGNYASAPDSSPLDITGDLEIVARVKANASGTFGFVCKALNINIGGYRALLNRPADVLSLQWYDGSALRTANSTVNDPFAVGTAGWVKVTLDVDNGSGGCDVKFYTAADSSSYPTSWTQLGATVTQAFTTSIVTNTSVLEIGASGGVSNYTGVFYRAIVRNGIDGTTVFDADFSAQAKGTTSFTESSSNAATVTVNQSGALPAHIGNAKDLLQGTGTNQPAYSAGAMSYDGTDNFMESNAVASMVQPLTRISVLTQDSWTLNDYLYDGRAANSGALYQSATTPDLVGNAGTAMTANGDAPVGTKVIVVSQFNGGSSFTRVNNNANVASAGGAANMLGVSQGASGTPGGYGDVTFYEDVIFESALTDAQIDSVVSALATLNAVAL